MLIQCEVGTCERCIARAWVLQGGCYELVRSCGNLTDIPSLPAIITADAMPQKSPCSTTPTCVRKQQVLRALNTVGHPWSKGMRAYGILDLFRGLCAARARAVSCWAVEWLRSNAIIDDTQINDFRITTWLGGLWNIYYNQNYHHSIQQGAIRHQ